MRYRLLGSTGALAVVMALAAVHVAGQTATGPTYTVPRTADGQADLQGVWSFATLTPLQRPSELAGKQVFTDEEAAQFEKNELVRRDEDRRDNATTGTTNGTEVTADVARAYNAVLVGLRHEGHRDETHLDHHRSSRRANSGVDAGSEEKTGGRQRAPRGRARTVRKIAAPSERCIHNGQGRDRRCLPAGYNNHIQVVQTPEYAAILNEQIHDVRLVPLDGRPHLDQRHHAVARRFAGPLGRQRRWSWTPSISTARWAFRDPARTCT